MFGVKKPTPTKPIDAKVQLRLDALERLIDTEYGGKPSVFEEKTGVKMAQVNQWFSGYRALRDKALKTLTEKTGKPEGYFDQVTLTPEAEANQQRILQLAALLRAIPDADVDKAYLAAVAALIAHLPESHSLPKPLQRPAA